MSARVRALTREESLAIHEASLERFGGLPGLRDEGLLESALAQPFQTFGGAELYPTFAEKAARYAYGIARNHPFRRGRDGILRGARRVGFPQPLVGSPIPSRDVWRT